MALTDHPGDDRWGPEQRTNRQLHDLVVPQLFVVSTGLAALRRRVSGEPTEELVETLAHAAEKALGDLRAISRGRPVSHGGDFDRLVARLNLTATTVARLTDCAVVIRSSGSLEPVDGLEDDLSAVIRECIVNAIRHGRASTVDVDLKVTDDALSVRVSDDGAWVTSVDPDSSGLAGLRERAARWQGRVVVEHGGEMTRVLWRIPLDTEGRPLV
ncbi:MAG: ATP-binding protein [Actinomycetota bacterium]